MTCVGKVHAHPFFAEMHASEKSLSETILSDHRVGLRNSAHSEEEELRLSAPTWPCQRSPSSRPTAISIRRLTHHRKSLQIICVHEFPSILIIVAVLYEA
jgi:hypothetical protein